MNTVFYLLATESKVKYSTLAEALFTCHALGNRDFVVLREWQKKGAQGSGRTSSKRRRLEGQKWEGKAETDTRASELASQSSACCWLLRARLTYITTTRNLSITVVTPAFYKLKDISNRARLLRRPPSPPAICKIINQTSAFVRQQ